MAGNRLQSMATQKSSTTLRPKSPEFPASSPDRVTPAIIKELLHCEYMQINNAILEGNGPRAELWTSKHIQKTGERTLPLLH